MPITPSLRHCSNKYKLASEGEKDKEKDGDFEKVIFYFILFFMMKSSRVGRVERYTFLFVKKYCFCLQPIRATLPHSGEILSLHVFLHKRKIYTEQNYKRNTFVFAPIFHELNSKI